MQTTSYKDFFQMYVSVVLKCLCIDIKAAGIWDFWIVCSVQYYCLFGSTLPGSLWIRTSTTTSEWVAWLLLKQLSSVFNHWPGCLSNISSVQTLMSGASVFGGCALSDAMREPEDKLCPVWSRCCRNWGIAGSNLDLTRQELIMSFWF